MRSLRLPRSLTPLGALVISALIALFFAIWSIATISLLPPGVHARQLQIGAAATHVMIDAPDSLLANDEAMGRDFTTYVKRAALYGDLLASLPVRERIGRQIGVPPDEIAAVSRITAIVQRTMREPDSEQRANQLASSKLRYRLEIQADPIKPIVHIYAQAPSAAAAVALADAAADGLSDYLEADARARGGAAGQQVRLDQLGRARGGVIGSQTRPVLVVLTFMVVFGVSLALLLGGARVRRGWIAARNGELEPAGAARAEPGGHGAAPGGPRRRTARTPRATMRLLVDAGGDWPRTTRVLPWMIAGFMIVLWLIPFNVIQLSASLPFDLKFDRLVLPVLFATWILAMATGGPAAPRIRITPIHVGILALTGVACIGVLLGAHQLSNSLEFELPVKKLTLLLSYGLFFVIVASSVRRSEVQAFMKYTLLLSVVCAVGVIWEYRFLYNVFHAVSDAALPGFFNVGAIDPNEVDDIGRRMTRGPAEHPLETVAMLSMGLPVALVGIIHSSERRARLLYGLAACILLAAAISTYRKSALLAPFAVVLTIAYFRRRELLKLAPLAALSMVLIHALSPGALGSILFQLHPTRLGVSTVSDRSADYDAIRPDLWTNLAFGRGYGSYDHLSYRILDSEILGRVVDTGVLGLLTLVLMLASIVFTARAPIRARQRAWAPPALAVACAAVAYLVLAFLFDVSAFPHTPYILMSLAGLLAAIVQNAEPRVTGHAGAELHAQIVRRRTPPPDGKRGVNRPARQAVHH